MSHTINLCVLHRSLAENGWMHSCVVYERMREREKENWILVPWILKWNVSLTRKNMKRVCVCDCISVAQCSTPNDSSMSDEIERRMTVPLKKIRTYDVRICAQYSYDCDGRMQFSWFLIFMRFKCVLNQQSSVTHFHISNKKLSSEHKIAGPQYSIFVSFFSS